VKETVIGNYHIIKIYLFPSLIIILIKYTVENVLFMRFWANM
jgi:hypothetical protein